MDFRMSPEHRELRARVRRLSHELEPVAATVPEGEMDPRLVRGLAGAGLFGLHIPPEFGGSAFAGGIATAIAIVREETSRFCPHLEYICAEQYLGGVPIAFFGTHDQKRRWLPAIASGDVLAAFALTEPGAGSDAAALDCRAERRGDVYVVNGEKAFISNAGVAGVYVLFAKTDPGAGSKGVSAFLLEPGGFEIEPWETMARHPIGKLVFRDYRLPAANLLGQEGQGFKIAMQTLDLLRTSVAAHAVGVAQRALDLAAGYARYRHTFGKPIAEHQAIQHKLADMAVQVKAGRLLTYHSAWRRDQGERVTMESAMAKVYCTEMAHQVVNHAVQIFGGYAFLKQNPMEFLYRVVRAPMVYEGSSEIQRLVIARELLGRAEEPLNAAMALE